LVIETEDGRVIAVEIKAGSRISARQLAGIRQLREKLGGRFLGGINFYTGRLAYTIEDRIHVLPLDACWS
jgi:hypothetical protein